MLKSIFKYLVVIRLDGYNRSVSLFVCVIHHNINVNMPATSSVKSLVLNVVKACTDKSKRNRPKVSFSNPVKRACYLLGMPERTLKRYMCGDALETDTVPSPSQASSVTKKERKKKLDNFDKVTIRNQDIRCNKSK